MTKICHSKPNVKRTLNITIEKSAFSFISGLVTIAKGINLVYQHEID